MVRQECHNYYIRLHVDNNIIDSEFKLAMGTEQNIQQVGIPLITKLVGAIRKIDPLYALYGILPLIFIYPKPLMIILKPILRNWSFHYGKMNSVSNKPVQIILTSNPSLCFSKEYLGKIKTQRGTLPEAFKKIQESMISQQKMRDFQDQSMRHIFIQKRHQFQKQRILNSCYVIDMLHGHGETNLRTASGIGQPIHTRKSSHYEVFKSAQLIPVRSIYSETDFIWLQMILMKLKLVQLENNSEVIKYVIVKANQRVLQLLECRILGFGQHQTFKLGSFASNKIHLLKFNKNLNTYEQCYTTFKIQQSQD